MLLIKQCTPWLELACSLAMCIIINYIGKCNKLGWQILMRWQHQHCKDLHALLHNMWNYSTLYI